MADRHLAAIESPRLVVALEPGLCAASLRYFGADNEFTRWLGDATGLKIPDALRTSHRNGDDARAATVLAWRSPTETILLTRDAGFLESLKGGSQAVAGGCVVDLSGGLLTFRARGDAVAALVATKAGSGAMPSMGEARRTRFADVSVMLVKVQPDELWLVVDRIYAPHLMASIRASVADL
jgi:heterotetrameric sarcosine oxidase gamma subunit